MGKLCLKLTLNTQGIRQDKQVVQSRPKSAKALVYTKLNFNKCYNCLFVYLMQGLSFKAFLNEGSGAEEPT